MKTKAFYLLIIFSLWSTILISYIGASDFLTSLTYFLFVSFLGTLFLFALFMSLKSLLFRVNEDRYYIRKGNHYADGVTRPRLRNIKFFFFKKEVEFFYKVNKKGIQNDAQQWNKIFGITSLFYRRNSARIVFRNKRPGGLIFQEGKYIYDKGGKPMIYAGRANLTDKWYKAKVMSPRLIWFGLYHFPYHGGKIESQKDYWIEISLKEPKELT